MDKNLLFYIVPGYEHFVCNEQTLSGLSFTVKYILFE